MPRLLHIHTAPSHGAAVVSHQAIEAVEGQGLVADRNFGRTRQVTLVCTGELESAAAELGTPIQPGTTRRNLTVDLPGLPRTNARITIGDVVLEVRRDCAPCEVMDSSVVPGARSALTGRAGVSAHVVSGGTLRVGDPVAISENPPL